MISTRCFIYFVLFHPIIRNGNCDNSSESSGDTSGNSTQTLNDDNNDETSEIHYANCKIVMDNLSVDAQAKFTRVFPRTLTGKMIEERFENLEKLLNERFNDLRDSIVRLPTNLNPNFLGTKDDAMRIEKANGRKNRLERNIFTFDENNFSSDTGNSVHQMEIDRYNNTVREISIQRKIYTYYWRVTNLSEKLSKRVDGRSERSSSFYVGAGYAMYMRFTANYYPDGPIFISVGLTAGRNDSKIDWPFRLRVRVEIPDLNQDSQLRDPARVCSPSFGKLPQGNIVAGTIMENPAECVVLGIPSKQYLIKPGKVSKDSLLIKLTVYL